MLDWMRMRETEESKDFGLSYLEGWAAFHWDKEERKDLNKKIRNSVFSRLIWRCLLVIQIKMSNRQLHKESGVQGRDQAGERNLGVNSLSMVFKAMRLVKTKDWAVRVWKGTVNWRGILEAREKKKTENLSLSNVAGGPRILKELNFGFRNRLVIRSYW